VHASHRILALIISLAVAVSVACTAGQAPPVGSRAADITAADSWLFFAFTLRPSPQQMLAVANIQSAFTSQPGWNVAVEALNKSAQSSTPDAQKVDLQRDVLPLLSGEVALSASGTSASPAVVILAESSDAERLIRIGAPKMVTPQTIKGATVIEYGAGTQHVVAAAFKGWAIVGQQRAPVESVIDRLTTPGGARLGQQARFRGTVDQLPRDRLALSYVDVGPLWGELLQEGVTSLPPELAEQFKNVPATGISVVTASDGLDFRIELSPMPASEESSALSPLEVGTLGGFSRLPASTLFAFTGGLPPEVIQLVPQILEGAFQSAGITFPTSAVHPEAWLRGEFAFGLTPGSVRAGFLLPSGTPSFFGLAGVTDAAAARRDLRIVEQVLPRGSVVETEVAGFALKQMEMDTDQVLTYGVIDDWLYAIFGGGDPAEVVAAAESDETLDTNPRFRTVRRILRDDAFNLFVDLDASRTLIEQLATTADPQTYQREVKPFLTPLRALGSSWWVDSPTGGANQLHARMFVAIQR
jgi:hypothetical protein